MGSATFRSNSMSSVHLVPLELSLKAQSSAVYRHEGYRYRLLFGVNLVTANKLP